MNKIKQQFSQLRDTTPKYVQWLLLAAAFIVVLILLTMLMTGKEKNAVADPDGTPVVVDVSANDIDWSNTTIGEKRTQSIKITTNAPARVFVRGAKSVAGFSMVQTCNTNGEIAPDFPCTITLEYAPTVAAAPQGVPVFVDWRSIDAPEELNTTTKIMVVVGADAPFIAQPAQKKEQKPEPVAIAEPKPVIVAELKPVVVAAPEPVVAAEPEPEPELDPEPEPVRAEIKREIETIAPPISTFEPTYFEDDQDDSVAAAPTPAEACSDFAFPGYGMSGAQIGWIRPEGGAYYFHPFSDKDCDTPTGIYNPDNGIITDIKNTGKKIGTDAEHIGYATISGGAIPQLANAPAKKTVNRARQSATPRDSGGMMRISEGAPMNTGRTLRPAPEPDVVYGTTGEAVGSTQPYDRTFILRQYKPIPATIVSDVRADVALDTENMRFPVRATVDRNVYSDNGRTIIIPTGTLLLGYVTGKVPGPYKAIGRMNIRWYQFVLPNGVEFNFESGQEPESADSQGRIGVPGRGTTDYLEQFVMPMLTAIVPAAVNMIAPVADKFVNQIDLDNNTVVQSGTLRSSELAKNEIITAWNQVAQKLMVDMMDNTTPPFTIPAGTRITVYSPVDLAVLCTGTGKKCDMVAQNSDSIHVNTKRSSRDDWKDQPYAVPDDGTWIGQSRSFNMDKYCITDNNGVWKVDNDRAMEITQNSGYSYSTVAAYCQAKNYKAINNARQEAIYQNQQSSSNTNSISNIGGGGSTSKYTQDYNQNILGLKYDDNGTIQNPFLTLPKEEAPAAATITCEDGTNPDANGCCTGEIYTDMGEQGFNCCPETGGDCFPPIL